jgi:hypothetical protein
MKHLLLIACFALSLLCPACGGSAAGEDQAPNYLDSTFVDADYREKLDAIGQDTRLPKEDREAIRAFVRRHRKRIPVGWTFGQILESANGMKKMRTDGMGLEVLNFARREELRVHEILMELKFKNTLEQGIETVYGDILIVDSAGKRLHASPPFIVQGPLAPGAETGLLRLQYGFERPTGNEMNDPKRHAVRDTLAMVKNFSKHFDASRMRFRVRDILLEGGLSVEDYWLLDEAGRKAAAKSPLKSVGLLDWADQNAELVKGMATTDGDYYLSVRPVLTDGYESVHGPFLLFDRRLKVVKHFTQNLDVPGNNIDPTGGGNVLHARFKIDFWDWPVELWVYKRQR